MPEIYEMSKVDWENSLCCNVLNGLQEKKHSDYQGHFAKNQKQNETPNKF